jgi:signal-transduction protein with cAMP-binding, CBS, and nucleotidyltransferase domain
MVYPHLRSAHTGLFRRLVRDYMDEPPPALPIGTSCRDVVAVLRKHAASMVVITDGASRLRGVVTDHDVAHGIAFRAPPTTPVNEIMTRTVHTVAQDEYLFRAIAHMRRLALHHLPVVDAHGHLCGILHMHRAMAETVPEFLNLIERLACEQNLPGLQQLKSAQVHLVEALANEQIPFDEIQRLLTFSNEDIYRHVVEQALTQMKEEGWGDPPVDFDVIIMGSGGRGESFLYPDQDNGFILEDYPATQHAAVDTYFQELAQRMTLALDAVGFALCRGHVMATNPVWRKCLSEWRHQIALWLRRPREATLRLCDIFFDFRPIFAHSDLAEHLRAYVTDTVPEHYPFLQQMQQVQSDHGVALGLRRRLTTESGRGPHKGKINLKYHALLPLVEAIRLLALREGLADTATAERIRALRRRGVLDRNEDDYLRAALRHITGIVLRQQVRDFRAARPVSTYVSPSALTTREKDELADELQAINALRQRTKNDFTAQAF